MPMKGIAMVYEYWSYWLSSHKEYCTRTRSGAQNKNRDTITRSRKRIFLGDAILAA
jgi:hypothetical protein